MEYPIRVLGGLPAIARVNYYLPYIPATWDDPAEGPELEWDLLDAKGRQADWLERRMTPDEMKEIEARLYAECATAYANRRYADL